MNTCPYGSDNTRVSWTIRCIIYYLLLPLLELPNHSFTFSNEVAFICFRWCDKSLWKNRWWLVGRGTAWYSRNLPFHICWRMLKLNKQSIFRRLYSLAAQPNLHCSSYSLTEFWPIILWLFNSYVWIVTVTDLINKHSFLANKEHQFMCAFSPFTFFIAVLMCLAVWMIGRG